MTSKEQPVREGPGAGRLPALALLAQCAGCGCMLSYYCCGPLAAAYFGSLLTGWAPTMMAQALAMAALGVGCLLVRRLCDGGRVAGRTAAGRICTALLVGVVALGWALGRLGAPAWGIYLCALALGACMAYPNLVWFEGFLTIWRTRGRGACIACMAASELVAVLSAGVAALVGGDPLATGCAVAVAACASQALQELAGRAGLGLRAQDGPRRPAQASYRLTPYSLGVLASFGVTWGLGVALISRAGADAGGAAQWAMTAAAALSCVAVGAAFGRVGAARRWPFGLLIRMTVVFSGTALALVPLLGGVAPAALHCLCQAVFVVLAIALNLFALEVCRERGLSVLRVWPANYLVFAAFALGAILAFRGLAEVLDPTRLAEAVALLASLAAFAVIPLLPSAASGATVFTLEHLPENEGFDARVTQARGSMAAKYGLSAREDEVLGLLLRGLTRNQIAQELSLSSWTVKDHIAKVYEKTGVHSAKELMVLATGGKAL